MTMTAQSDSAPGTVLVIDDDETNRYILTSWLTRAGHTVLGAADGSAGLALLEEAGRSLPEVAIIDVQLPDMSGFEVCERIKADPRTAFLPVVHVSAVAVNAEDHTEGLSRGADAYLDQPIDPNEFLATVTAALRYTRARRRAEHLTLRLAALNRATLDVYRAVGFADFCAAATGGAASLMSGPATAIFLSPDGLARAQPRDRTGRRAGHPARTGGAAGPAGLPGPRRLHRHRGRHGVAGAVEDAAAARPDRRRRRRGGDPDQARPAARLRRRPGRRGPYLRRTRSAPAVGERLRAGAGGAAHLQRGARPRAGPPAHVPAGPAARHPQHDARRALPA